MGHGNNTYALLWYTHVLEYYHLFKNDYMDLYGLTMEIWLPYIKKKEKRA